MVSSKQSEATVLDLESAIEQLGNVPSGRVLSAYVDTSPLRIEGQKYLLAYRDSIRSMRPDLPLGDTEVFESAAAEIERYLAHGFTPLGRGLAVFASASPERLVLVPLPDSPPAEYVAWQGRPEIGPLQAMLDEYERIAVALFDAEQARLFSVFLGQIENQQTLHADVPAKQATGGWFALQQTSFERHREDHLRRHAQATARALMAMLRNSSFDRLLIGGPEEAVALFRRELPRPLQARLAGTLDIELFASDAQVLQATLRAAEGIERQNEQRLVDELLESATAPHVVFGVAGTLGALSKGRVHLLLVTDTFAEAGGECSRCGRLVTDARRCPGCGIPTVPVTNLREAVLQQALAQGARVETVAGEAAARLGEYGGIGAWTRF